MRISGRREGGSASFNYKILKSPADPKASPGAAVRAKQNAQYESSDKRKRGSHEDSPAPTSFAQLLLNSGGSHLYNACKTSRVNRAKRSARREPGAGLVSEAAYGPTRRLSSFQMSWAISHEPSGWR
jgi:hypothetical protein